MNIVIFNGSPRGSQSNTHVMTEAFAKGAEGAGAKVENILLADKKIHHCMGCFACWTKTPGRCVLEDDMAELLPKFASADIIVFATPLYADIMTGLMKNFIDRLIPGADPSFAKDDNDECRHPSNNEKIPKLVVLANCGFPEQSHFQVLHLYFQRLARNMNSEVIAEIYRSEGPLLTAPTILLKPVVFGYKKLLKQAGMEVVKNLTISKETQQKLEKLLIPEDLYIKQANEYFARQK